MPEKYIKYRELEERMLIMKQFFSEFFRQTISKNGMGENVDFTILELKGISAFLDHDREYTMSELSHNAHLPLSNISAIVDRLARKGIAKRRRDLKDRRVVRAHLTEKDRRDLFNALEKATKIFQRIEYS